MSLINSYIKDNCSYIPSVDFKTIERQCDYDNFFKDNEKKRKDGNKGNHPSFCVIQEKDENRYHFLLLMNYYDKTYIFDSIKRNGELVDINSDWDKALLKNVESSDNTFMVSDAGLQKDGESCGDYVVEFFKILVNKYKLCQQQKKIFGEYIDCFLNPVTEIMTEEDKPLLKFLPPEFVELAQSTTYIKDYIDKYNEQIYNLGYNLESGIGGGSYSLPKLETDCKKIKTLLECGDENIEKRWLICSVFKHFPPEFQFKKNKNLTEGEIDYIKKMTYNKIDERDKEKISNIYEKLDKEDIDKATKFIINSILVKKEAEIDGLKNPETIETSLSKLKKEREKIKTLLECDDKNIGKRCFICSVFKHFPPEFQFKKNKNLTEGEIDYIKKMTYNKIDERDKEKISNIYEKLAKEEINKATEFIINSILVEKGAKIEGYKNSKTKMEGGRYNGKYNTLLRRYNRYKELINRNNDDIKKRCLICSAFKHFPSEFQFKNKNLTKEEIDYIKEGDGKDEEKISNIYERLAEEDIDKATEFINSKLIQIKAEIDDLENKIQNLKEMVATYCTELSYSEGKLNSLIKKKEENKTKNITEPIVTRILKERKDHLRELLKDKNMQPQSEQSRQTKTRYPQ